MAGRRTNDWGLEAVRRGVYLQKTYNDLLSAAPYSPPVKDFGINTTSR